MRFEDLRHVDHVLRLKNPVKTAFLLELKAMSPKRAKELTNDALHDVFSEDPLFSKAKVVGVSKTTVLEIARWILYESEWNEYEVNRL